ncbi:MAG: metal ABC transporter ATP-binding protein [Cyanobacteriota bacterium]|nr:metal ABC transporter ATP-binding protein [Cyanobacteriota bacterium]
MKINSPSHSMTALPPSALSRITITDLRVSYRSHLALDQITTQLAAGQLTGIVGPNGAGKSTLIKAMLGLIPIERGEITLDGQPVSGQRRRIAYLPQRSQIDWTYPATVWDVVLMGRVRKTGWLRHFSSNSRELAHAALARVGLADLANRPIGQLSGGQQQRVFLARALAQEADILALDEPFAGVDQKTEGILFDILRQLADQGSTVLIIHHDLGTAIRRFDHLLLLNQRLIAQGSPHQVLQPHYVQQAYGGYGLPEVA